MFDLTGWNAMIFTAQITYHISILEIKVIDLPTLLPNLPRLEYLHGSVVDFVFPSLLRAMTSFLFV